jgi:hypothetical protein
MNTMSMHATAQAKASWGTFARHLIEMIVAMLVGMAVLGTIVSSIFGLLGHANLLHYAGLRGLLMTAYMVAAMSLWMRHRNHSWAAIGEMSVAMICPYLVLVGPFWAGAISAEAFLIAMHVLMLPAMIVAMLHRRYEYSQDHRRHEARHATHATGVR